MLSDAVQCHINFQSKRVKCLRMACDIIRRNFFDSDAADTTDRVCKILVNEFLFQSDCLKNLSSLIRLDCRNTHLGCNLYNSSQHCIVIIINCRIIVFLKHIGINKLFDGFMCKIRVDRTCTITDQCRKMMYFSWFSRLQNNSHRRTFLRTYQMLLQSGKYQK